jgi:peptide/nickel transport system ATP-binding protein
MTAALKVTDLAVSAQSGPLVRGVSFAVEQGAGFTILGETGSGKSLLSQAIMATLPPDLTASGRIGIQGSDSDAADPSARRGLWGRSLALLPQEPWLSLDPTMRTIDQVAEGYAGADRRDARPRARAALAALGLAGFEDHYPFRLSGGMAQRVAIAATGAGGAPIVIVDEPTKGLDAALRDDVVSMLRGLMASGRTLLTITHDVHVARALGGEIAVMLEGEIVEQGAAESVLSEPRHPYTRRLLAADPAAWTPRPAPSVGAPILIGSGLTKRYGGKTLFADLDITVRSGDRLAVVGPSGSGKTTVGNILLGLTRPDLGSVVHPGHGGAFRFQKLYQDPVAAFPPRSSLRRTFIDLIERHRLDRRPLEGLMARLRLDEGLLERRPDQVSGGELQRFALARLLLVSPRLIFADEPTSRLDLITQQDTLNLLVEHASERDCALLLVTHDADIATNVAGSSLISIHPSERLRP